MVKHHSGVCGRTHRFDAAPQTATRADARRRLIGVRVRTDISGRVFTSCEAIGGVPASPHSAIQAAVARCAACGGGSTGAPSSREARKAAAFPSAHIQRCVPKGGARQSHPSAFLRCENVQKPTEAHRLGLSWVMRPRWAVMSGADDPNRGGSLWILERSFPRGGGWTLLVSKTADPMSATPGWWDLPDSLDCGRAHCPDTMLSYLSRTDGHGQESETGDRWP